MINTLGDFHPVTISGGVIDYEFFSVVTGWLVRQICNRGMFVASIFQQVKARSSFSIVLQTLIMEEAKVMARIVEADGRAEFCGQIIARKDNKDIQSIEDCSIWESKLRTY